MGKKMVCDGMMGRWYDDKLICEGMVGGMMWGYDERLMCEVRMGG